MKQMDIVEITDENIEDFEELLGEDVKSDLSREFYRGLGAVDDDGEAKGVFVYELLAVDDDDEDTRSALRLLSADSADTYSALHQAYRESRTNHLLLHKYWQWHKYHQQQYQIPAL